VAAENVEIVRLWLEASSVSSDQLKAIAAECWDADADYYPARKFPEARPCHGIEEVTQFMLRFREAWSRYDFAINEILEVADDRVLACANLRAEGRGSGMNLEGDLYECVWLRHGRFFRVEDHLTLKGALRALGLEGVTLEAAGLRA
jgi:hypothetical protein